MKKIFLFCIFVSLCGFVFPQTIIIGNAENCPFSILNIEKASLASGDKNSNQHGKAYSIEVLPAAELESFTVSAIVVDRDGIVKGMDSRNFKGNFNQHRTYKVIINNPEINVEDTDSIYFIPYFSGAENFYWLIIGNSVYDFLKGISNLKGVIIEQSPGSQPAPTKCTVEQLKNACDNCASIASKVCVNGRVTQFKCTCDECSFTCSYSDGQK